MELIYPQAVLGYREWTIVRGELWPLFDHLGGGAWSCDPTEPARCAKHAHPAPREGCSCGWHGWYEPKGMHAWRRLRGDAGGTNYVAGAFAAAGDICAHSEGFRAELAQVLCLVSGGPKRDRSEQAGVAERLGVPLLSSRREARRYAENLCEPLPRALRPGV